MALHRLHRTRVALGEFVGSATFDRETAAILANDLETRCSRVGVSSALIMLKLINTRLRTPGRPCRGSFNGDDRPPNASVSKIGAMRHARAFRRGLLSTAHTRRPCDAHKPLRPEWSLQT